MTGIFTSLASVVLLSGIYVNGQAAGKPEGNPRLVEAKTLGEEAMPARENTLDREGESLGLPLTAQLKQVLELEEQLEGKLSAKEQARVRALYEALLVDAVTGGYDREQGITNRYAKEGGRYLDQRMADYYRDFVSANGDSRTAVILKEYLQILEGNDLRVDSQVLDFYETVPELVWQWSQLGPEDFRYWVWKLGLLKWFE